MIMGISFFFPGLSTPSSLQTCILKKLDSEKALEQTNGLIFSQNIGPSISVESPISVESATLSDLLMADFRGGRT